MIIYQRDINVFKIDMHIRTKIYAHTVLYYTVHIV